MFNDDNDSIKTSHFQDHQTHQSTASVVSLKRTSYLEESTKMNCLPFLTQI